MCCLRYGIYLKDPSAQRNLRPEYGREKFSFRERISI